MTSFAQIINDYRAFPRLFAVYYIWGMAKVLDWAMDQPALSAEQSAMIIAVITGAAAYFKFYVESGPKSNGGRE